MCSISTNHTVDTQLEDLERSNDRVMIEKRLYNFAKEADINNPGRLDSPTCRIKRLPDDLKALRKIQIGRHRIYFTGHCNQCSYKTILIKLFKKSDKDQEDSRHFQKKLQVALKEDSMKNICIDIS